MTSKSKQTDLTALTIALFHECGDPDCDGCDYEERFQERFFPESLRAPLDFNSIQPSPCRWCADCGVGITPLNDSGWEVFTAPGGLTQPVCRGCDRKRSFITQKADSHKQRDSKTTEQTQ